MPALPRGPALDRDPLRPTVLGIDPGTHVCGWGVVSAQGPRLRAEGFGAIRARATAPVAERLATIAKGLREVVSRFAPTEAAIEEVFYGRDVRAAVRIGEGRGAALVVLAEAGIPVAGYANNVVKRSVTGGGRATKPRVQAMVRAILSLTEWKGPLDASDALALAVCHHHARRGAGASAATASRRPGTSIRGVRYSARIADAIRRQEALERARRAAAGGARP